MLSFHWTMVDGKQWVLSAWLTFGSSQVTQILAEKALHIDCVNAKSIVWTHNSQIQMVMYSKWTCMNSIVSLCVVKYQPTLHFFTRKCIDVRPSPMWQFTLGLQNNPYTETGEFCYIQRNPNKLHFWCSLDVSKSRTITSLVWQERFKTWSIFVEGKPQRETRGRRWRLWTLY